MAGLAWSEKLSIDGGVIDSDHKHLLIVTGNFLQCGQGARREQLCAFIDDLEHFATAHFRREEAIQRAIEYKWAQNQNAEHIELLATLAQIRDRLHQVAAAALDDCRREIGALIRHWLIDHILNSDSGMKPYRDLIILHSGGIVPLSSEKHRSNRIIGSAKSKGLTIDHGVIDEDHRALISLINDFILEENDGYNPVKLRATIAALHAYANIHFKREEELQRAVGFPFHEAHRRAHRDLLSDLDRIGDDLLSRHSAHQHGTLSNFLREWLVEHVQDADMRMRPYVDEMKKMRSTSHPHRF